MVMVVVVVVAVLSLAWPAPGAAAESPAVASCLVIDDPGERLSCFDALHGREPTGQDEPGSPETPEPPTPPDDQASAATIDEPAPASPAPPPRARGSFGAEQLPTPPAEPSSPQELVTEVTDVGRQPTGRHWFRLSNGQLWSQVSAGIVHVEPGDRVRIRRGRFGTYHLRPADGSGRSTQVRRDE